MNGNRKTELKLHQKREVGSNALNLVVNRWNENCKTELLIVTDERVGQGINELEFSPNSKTNEFIKERSSQTGPMVK